MSADLAHLGSIYRNETFNFAAGALTPKLYVWIHDHKTLGKDKLLGEGEIDVCIESISFSYCLRIDSDLATHSTGRRLGSGCLCGTAGQWFSPRTTGVRSERTPRKRHWCFNTKSGDGSHNVVGVPISLQSQRAAAGDGG
jgi:hypothetical protein